MAKNNTLHLAGLFPLTNESTAFGASEGPGVLPAVVLGLQHVNDDPDILPDYKLEIDFNDTKVRGLIIAETSLV